MDGLKEKLEEIIGEIKKHHENPLTVRSWEKWAVIQLLCDINDTLAKDLGRKYILTVEYEGGYVHSSAIGVKV